MRENRTLKYSDNQMQQEEEEDEGYQSMESVERRLMNEEMEAERVKLELERSMSRSKLNNSVKGTSEHEHSFYRNNRTRTDRGMSRSAHEFGTSQRRSGQYNDSHYKSYSRGQRKEVDQDAHKRLSLLFGSLGPEEGRQLRKASLYPQLKSASPDTLLESASLHTAHTATTLDMSSMSSTNHSSSTIGTTRAWFPNDETLFQPYHQNSNPHYYPHQHSYHPNTYSRMNRSESDCYARDRPVTTTMPIYGSTLSRRSLEEDQEHQEAQHARIMRTFQDQQLLHQLELSAPASRPIRQRTSRSRRERSTPPQLSPCQEARTSRSPSTSISPNYIRRQMPRLHDISPPPSRSLPAIPPQPPSKPRASDNFRIHYTDSLDESSHNYVSPRSTTLHQEFVTRSVPTLSDRTSNRSIDTASGSSPRSRHTLPFDRTTERRYQYRQQLQQQQHQPSLHSSRLPEDLFAPSTRTNSTTTPRQDFPPDFPLRQDTTTTTITTATTGTATVSSAHVGATTTTTPGGLPTRLPPRHPSQGDESVPHSPGHSTRRNPSPGPSPIDPTSQNNYIDIGQGKRVILRSDNDTRAAIVNDFYVPKVCFGCSLDLFCIKDVHYFLCPVCKVVSPMHDGNEDYHNSHNQDSTTQDLPTRSHAACMGFTFERLFEMQAEILQADLNTANSS